MLWNVFLLRQKLQRLKVRGAIGMASSAAAKVHIR